MSLSSKRDDVSAIMGSLLMKGYKMLADSCTTCNNVLMQDKKGVILCVNCNESKSEQKSNIVPDSSVGHKLPEHGYSEGHPYQKTENSETFLQLSEMLLSDIQIVTTSLKNNPISVLPEELNSRMLNVKYIRECAATIKALQDIGMQK